MTTQIIDPGLIDPNPYQSQTRLTFTSEQLADLESVKDIGFIHVPIARPHPATPGRFQMNVGWRRRCAWLLYRPGEPMMVDVQELSDEQMFDQSAIENSQRADLSAIEKALIIQRAVADFGKSQLEAGKLVGLTSQGAASNLLRMLQLPDEIRGLVASGQLPERHARQLIGLARIKPGEAAKIAHQVADSGNPDEALDDGIGQYLDKIGGDLHATDIPVEWVPVAPMIIEGNSETPPSCARCPNHLSYEYNHYCARPACMEAKAQAWKQLELDRVSAKLGIPIAGDGDKAVKLVLDYNDDDRAKEMLRSKSRAELFRLMPNDDGKRNYYHEQVLGSNAVVLAAFDPKLLDRKAGQPVPPKTADEAPEAKATREAAEERERDKRRNEKARLRKAKADIFWLVSHTAEAVAPKMLISGGILEFAENVIDHRFQSSYNEWPEMREFRLALETETSKAKGDARELLLRQRIVVSEANRELNVFRPEEQFSWPRALGRIETLISKTFKLALPAGWDQPPIHHTPSNCWACGKFTSQDHITKLDESNGWQTAPDNVTDAVTCSDKCRADVGARPSKTKRATAKERNQAYLDRINNLGKDPLVVGKDGTITRAKAGAGKRGKR